MLPLLTDWGQFMKSKLSHIGRCELTDHYEVAIMHQSHLHIRWKNEDVEYDQRVMPTDLSCVHGKEYLLVTTSEGESIRICLDQIVDVKEFPH